MDRESFNTQIVETDKGNIYVLKAKLGAGGQGAVFRVHNNDGLLVKAKVDAEGRIVQDKNIYSKYCWNIIKIMTMPHIPYVAQPIAALKSPACGYVMQFLEKMDPIIKDMMPDSDGNMVKHYIKRGGLLKRIKTLRRIAEIMKNIHNNGLVYCDISTNNVFVSGDCAPRQEKPTDETTIFDSKIIETENYEAWLIDLDNLEHCGETRSIGTMYYRAPEVFNGKQNTVFSDRYSFALLAFEYLTYSKPFEGELSENNAEGDSWDEASASDDWGDDSLESNGFFDDVERGVIPYVCDPKDRSNSQIYGLPIEEVSTVRIRNLFEQTFSEEGRMNPETRPSMAEWYSALDDAALQLTTCDYGHSHFGKECMFCRELKLKNANIPFGKYLRIQFFRQVEIEIENEENEIIEELDRIQDIYYSKNAGYIFDIPWSAICRLPERYNHLDTDIALTLSIKNDIPKLEVTAWSNLSLSSLPNNSGYRLSIISMNKVSEVTTIKFVEL